MKTAIISDLHLGVDRAAATCCATPRSGPFCSRSCAAPTAWSCSATWSSCANGRSARRSTWRCPPSPRLGAAVGDVEVVLVPGNHDARLAEPLLDGLSIAGAPLAARLRPPTPPRPDRGDRRRPRPGPPADRLPRHLAARRRLRHPRPLHGRPPAPCRAPSASPSPRSSGFAGPNSPTRRPPTTTSASSAPSTASPSGPPRSMRRRPRRRERGPSEAAWELLVGDRPDRTRARRAKVRAVRAAFPLAVAGVNRLLHADFDADISGAAIFRSGVAGAAEMARRLGVDAGHVITGHTHRGGPRPEEGPWRTARRRRAPQHRQLGLLDPAPQPGRAAELLLAGDRHLGRGLGPAAPRRAAPRPHPPRHGHPRRALARDPRPSGLKGVG